MPAFPPNNLGDVVGLGRSILSGGLGLGPDTRLIQPRSPAAAVGSQSRDANRIVRNPRQAASTFDIGGVNAIRPKGTFFARFKRAGSSDGMGYWERDHGFMVKTVDTPTINIKLEEISQYNRTRQVVTGYTTTPINLTLYDTADAMVLRMWNDYVRYYIADFDQTKEAYAYDVVPLEGDNNAMRGADIGYGFKPKMDTQTLSGDTQFFFHTLEIYQVFRNAYTLVTLVNPRIASFDTDELDYSTMEPVTHRLSVAYEAVLYENGGAPLEITGELKELFADIRLHGDVIDIPANPKGVNVASTQQNRSTGMPNIFQGGGLTIPGLPNAISNRSGLGGVLGAFGNFNFGSAAATAARSIISGNTDNLASTLLYAATGNAQLATIVNMATSGQSRSAIGQQFLYGAMQSGGISPAILDAASGAIAAANGDRLAAGVLAESLINGVMASASHAGTSARQQVSGQGGLTVSGSTIEVVNATRPPSSQIGYRGIGPN